MTEKEESLDEIVARLTLDMQRRNSEAALQAIVELMLCDHTSTEVVRHLRAWADYLEARI